METTTLGRNLTPEVLEPSLPDHVVKARLPDTHPVRVMGLPRLSVGVWGSGVGGSGVGNIVPKPQTLNLLVGIHVGSYMSNKEDSPEGPSTQYLAT